MPVPDTGRLLVSIDVEGPLTDQALAPVIQILQSHQVAACWAVANAGQAGESLMRRVGPESELALLAESHWFVGGRTRFAKELKQQMTHVAASGLDVHTLVAADSRRLCYPDLMVRHRLSVARGQQTGRDPLRAQSLRFGTWQAAPTLDLTELASSWWSKWTLGWKASRQLESAAEFRGIAHVMLRVTQTAPSASQLRALDKVCRQASLLRGNGRLRIETMAATVKALCPQPQAAGRSVLHAA